MKRFFVIPFLFIVLALGFTACSDDDDSIFYFWDEPAIVTYQSGSPMIQTSYGLFSAPSLGTTLTEGTYLWTAFTYDDGNQPDPNVRTITALQYKILGGTEALVSSGEMIDAYTDSIDVAVLYNSFVGNVLFFGFEQTAPSGQAFDYEIICNTDSLASDETPILFLKTKRTGTPSAGSNTTVVTRYAFDMTPFLEHMGNPKNTNVNLYLKYKIGTSEGKDVYKSFNKYPIPWKL